MQGFRRQTGGCTVRPARPGIVDNFELFDAYQLVFVSYRNAHVCIPISRMHACMHALL